MRGMRLCVLAAAFAGAIGAREPARWSTAKTAHFEVYSDAGSDATRALTLGLERLHEFFVRQIGLRPAPRREVRVICFASPAEYAKYRMRPGADAYFIGMENRDYIVLPRPELRLAAHEYAHVLVHSSGWKLPEWMAEGVSDVVSTVQLEDRETRIGGDLPGRSAMLKRGKWMPIDELFGFHNEGTSERTGLFYAESWALADLLMFGRDYREQFPALLAALATGVPPERALAATYGVAPAKLEADARARVARMPASERLPGVGGAANEVRVADTDEFGARMLLADLRFVNGDAAEAEGLYRALAAERPDDADAHAALGGVLMQRGNAGAAMAEWKRAIELGMADAALCFRYAVLADERGLPARAALERAIALRPDFDDARYKLALMEKNSGHAEAAVGQLHAMRQVAPERAFAWWTALADAQLDLGRREEAKQAAAEARKHAASAEERERADQIAWMASTELAVQIENGKFRTVRVPVNAPARNPFVEAGDRVRKVEAALREVECSESGIRLVVEGAQGALTLGVPDPSRVEIRNAGGVKFEFVCGPQEPRQVVVEYAAATMVLRGLELK